MFSRSDFWVGLAVGALAGAFGYKLMSEQSLRGGNQFLPAFSGQGTGEPSMEELMRQKEHLEDLIAEKQQQVTGA